MIKDMPDNLKQILTAYNVPTSTIKLINDEYNGILTDSIEGIKKAIAEQEEQPKANDSKRPSVQDMARETRIIK